MKNPFKFGGIVKDTAFCNRVEEVRDLSNAIKNSSKLFLYSERRLGKTSLIKKVLSSLHRDKFIIIYVDLWPTDGEVSFLTTFAKAVSEATARTTDKLLQVAKTFFNVLTPSIKIDNDGKAAISFGFNSITADNPIIENVLASAEKIAIKEGKQAVIVFDEFQQILEYESDIIERVLRSVIQDHQNVAYIFCGSKKHLIKKMFLDSNRPLYRSGIHYPIHLINLKHWMPFIYEKFESSSRQIEKDIVEKIVTISEGHPFYTQHLCHLLWEMCEKGDVVTENMLDKAITILLERESYAYSALWDSLSKNSKRILKGVAEQTNKTGPFSSEFLRKYKIANASSAQRAIDALLSRDIIDKDGKSLIITDRFFRLWINSKQS